MIVNGRWYSDDSEIVVVRDTQIRHHHSEDEETAFVAGLFTGLWAALLVVLVCVGIAKAADDE